MVLVGRGGPAAVREGPSTEGEEGETVVRCPSCGAEVRGQKKFCGVCGATVDTGSAAAPTGPTSGGSSVRVDADGLNMVLSELSNAERRLSFEGGKLRVAQGAVSGDLGLNLVPSALDASVTWSGPMGAIHVRLEQVLLDEQGLEIKIKLSR